MLSGIAPWVFWLHLCQLLPSNLADDAIATIATTIWKSLKQQSVTSLFMIGDSTMQKQKEALWLEELNLRKYIVSFRNAGGGHCQGCDLPSLQRKRACQFVKSQNASKGNSIAYLNFGSLHLMHLHPERPWEISEKKFGGKNTADLSGFLFLEDWIFDEIECLSKLVGPIIVQTPHHICDEVFTGRYKKLLRNPKLLKEGLVGCASSISTRSAIPASVALNLCENSLLAGTGSANIATRMRNAIQSYLTLEDQKRKRVKTSVYIIDAHKITASLPNCSAYTKDGRHYDNTIIKQELQLLSDLLVGR